jgi:hypothetical protein
MAVATREQLDEDMQPGQPIDFEDYGLSEDAVQELGTQFVSEQFQYFELITKSPFAFHLISQITTWQDKQTGRWHYSPYTMRTQRGLINLIRAITERAVYLANITKDKERLFDLEIEQLITVSYQQFDLVDTNRPSFFPHIKLIRLHAKFVMTRASGPDRERMMQRGPKTVTEQRVLQGLLAPPKAPERRGFRLFKG